MRLFVLTPEYDKRGYCPFDWLEHCGLVRDEYKLWEEQPLAAAWKPMKFKVVLEKKAGDFYKAMEDFAATEKAVQVLRAEFRDEFEALPLQITKARGKSAPKTGGTDRMQPEVMLVIHPLQYVPLGKDTKVTLYPNGRIMRVDHYAFRKRDLKGKNIFLVKGKHIPTLVSEEFRETVESAGLKGLGFQELKFTAS